MRTTLLSVAVCLMLAVQALVPPAVQARPAKFEISNGLGITLFLVGSAVFGAVVSFSPKSEKGGTAKKKKKTVEVEEIKYKTAEEMRKELEEMRGH